MTDTAILGDEPSLRESPRRSPTTPAECVFFGELASKGATARSLAVCYAFLIAQETYRHSRGEPRDPMFWPWINQALNERIGFGSLNKIDRFRRTAWAIHDATAQAAVSARKDGSSPQNDGAPQ